MANNSAPARTSFLGAGDCEDIKKDKRGTTDTRVSNPTFRQEDNLVPIHLDHPNLLLGKYIKPEKVSVVLVRNCGILLEEEPELTHPPICSHKKDSIFQQHKIPIEIRRNGRSQTNKKGWRRFGGIIFGVVSSLCFSLTLLLAKVLREQHDHHPISITTWRYIGILVPAIPISIYYNCFTSEPVFDSIWPINNAKNLKHCSIYILQGICGCSSIIFRFYSLEFISLADATVVSFSSPVFVTILAHFCLGEKCSILSIFVAILTAFGVVVIARPPLLTGGSSSSLTSDVWVGVVLAVASMAFASGLLILMRNIRHTHYSLMLLVSGSWGVAQSGILGWSLSVLQSPDTAWVAFLIGLLCVLTFFGQITIILALKYENAGPVAVIRSSEVLFAYWWQLQFFGIYPDIYSAVGASILIFSVIAIATKSWVAGLPKTTDGQFHRKRLLILTK